MGHLRQSAQLLKQFYESGDKNALGNFFVENFDLIFRISFHFTKNKADAEDVCQQVIIKVMDTSSKCNGAEEGSDQAVLGWLSILTANQARMYLRTNKRNLLRDKKKGEEMKEEKSDKTRFEGESSENDGILVNQALDKIPMQYKSAILLKYYDGLSYHEIAKVLGLREVTIRSYVSRGIDELRLILNKRNASTMASATIISLLSKNNFYQTSYAENNKLIEKVINSSNSQRAQILNKTRHSSLARFKFWIILPIICGLIFVGMKYFRNETTSNLNKKTEHSEPTIFSKSWDFSKDSADDIKIIHGSWAKDTTSNFMVSPNNEDLVIELPFNFLNFYKLTVESLWYQRLPNGGRIFTFQPHSEFSPINLISKEAKLILSDKMVNAKMAKIKDRIYYNVGYQVYYFNDYLLIFAGSSKPHLIKVDNARNQPYKILIKNLEISKMKYQPITKEDSQIIKSKLEKLEENMDDKNSYIEVYRMLTEYFNKQL